MQRSIKRWPSSSATSISSRTDRPTIPGRRDISPSQIPGSPRHYGSLRSGGKQIREAFGVPCGLALAPSLESNITLHTLLYAFRSHVVDSAGNVTIDKNARTVEALKYAKALNADAGTPEALTWGPSGNVRAMLARKTSCTVSAISLLRAAEK